MPSVLAIVSKAIFEKLTPQRVAIGDLVALDRYTSQNPAFESLLQSGAIFLVTVRPPDEQLWLVGIVGSPRRVGRAWVGTPNQTRVVDVTPAVAKLELSTGKGLHPKKGTLGMSLQTPRILTDRDETILRGIADGNVRDAQTRIAATNLGQPRAHVESAKSAVARGDRAAVVEELLASWRVSPAVEIAAAIETLAPLPALQEVTAGSAAEAFARATAFERHLTDPRIAAAALGWIVAFHYHATSSKPFWRVAFRLVENNADPRALTALDEKRVPHAGATMRGWMQEQIVATRTRIAARFSSGTPNLTDADAAALAKVVAATRKLAQPAPRGATDGDEQSLLRAVYERPDDDGPRGVYSDWLLERGDPRGEFIALQLARGRRAPDEDEVKKETALLAKHFRSWIGELATATRAKVHSVGVHRYDNNRFERGFLVATGLRGSDASLEKAIGNPMLATVERLNLSQQLDIALAAALVLHPIMRALVAVAGPHGLVERLASQPLGDRLRELAIDAREPGQAVSAVAAARRFSGLTRLRLDASGGYMGHRNRTVQADPQAADLAAMASAVANSRLQRLELELTGVEAVLVREGKTWVMRLSVWERSRVLGELLDALARCPIRSIVNANSTSTTYQAGVKIASRKPPLPVAVKRAFPKLKIEDSTDEDDDDTYDENAGRVS